MLGISRVSGGGAGVTQAVPHGLVRAHVSVPGILQVLDAPLSQSEVRSAPLGLALTSAAAASLWVCFPTSLELYCSSLLCEALAEMSLWGGQGWLVPTVFRPQSWKQSSRPGCPLWPFALCLSVCTGVFFFWFVLFFSQEFRILESFSNFVSGVSVSWTLPLNQWLLLGQKVPPNLLEASHHCGNELAFSVIYFISCQCYMSFGSWVL